MVRAAILIVEDELITAADLEDVLIRLGYHVAGTASSGEEAIRRAEQTSPDLVLMDIHLAGDMDGTQAANEIRRRMDIPVIYLTAHADSETLARAKQAQPLGYVVKPFQEPELQAAIEIALHKSRVDFRAKEREETLSSTLGALGEGVIALDELLQVTYMNPSAEEWTAWRAEDARGRDLNEVFPLITQKDRQPVGAVARSALRDGVFDDLPDACVLAARNGIERRISGTVSPIRDQHGHVSGAVIAFMGVADSIPKEPAATAQPPYSTGKTEIIVHSPVMKDLMKFCVRVASSGVSSILLQGESGTGKDVIARFLHQNSRRRDKPFVSVNCAAIPETLVESELFGYEKGAFTDARSQKRGVLELAHSGTVFLDEIGELQLHLQTKLLRVLEDQTFRRLGGVKDVQVDIRIVTATNKNLFAAVQRHEFREDLFYRLNVIQIAIPPLREHPEDILPLAEHFIHIYNPRFERSIEGLTPEAEASLLSHNWPGNVRELRNAIERGMVLEEGTRLSLASLSMEVQPSYDVAAAASSGNVSLEEVERTLLQKALDDARGNQSEAARRLGISRDTLRYRIKKFDLQ
jgi:PAS domain S-box-containing protein